MYSLVHRLGRAGKNTHHSTQGRDRRLVIYEIFNNSQDYYSFQLVPIVLLYGPTQGVVSYQCVCGSSFPTYDVATWNLNFQKVTSLEGSIKISNHLRSLTIAEGSLRFRKFKFHYMMVKKTKSFDRLIGQHILAGVQKTKRCCERSGKITDGNCCINKLGCAVQVQLQRSNKSVSLSNKGGCSPAEVSWRCAAAPYINNSELEGFPERVQVSKLVT